MEERRAKRQKEEQDRLREYLNRQVEEKKQREDKEKQNINNQAKMWEVDRRNHEEEEKRLKDKINQINKQNADFLLQQMAAKHVVSSKMNSAEFAINRPLLREVNQKLKTSSNYEGSVGGN